MTGARLGEKLLDQRRDVLAPRAQRRQLERDDLEAVQQVLAKPALLDQHAQVAMGRGDHAHVDLALAGAADRAHAVGLEHLQQLRLQRRRHLADLVEQQRAAVGFDEHARAVAVAPVNAPLT